jgi:hypothetical protein
MLPLNRLNLLRRTAREKVHQFIQKHGDKPVRIYSDQWGAYWRSGRAGYTYQRDEAGTYTFAEAFDATCHCGHEKHIYYQFIRA